MSPIDFDGDFVTAITFDGDDIRQVTMDGDIVWEKDNIFINIVDNFEDNNISEYNIIVQDGNGNLTKNGSSGFTTTSSTVKNGSYSCKADWADEERAIVSTNFSVSNGKKYRGSIYILSDCRASIIFGTQSESYVSGYGLEISTISNEFDLKWWGDGTSILEKGEKTTLKGESVTVNTDTWYDVFFEWGSGGALKAKLYDNKNNKISELNFTDQEYTSGGIGCSMESESFANDVTYFDYIREVK